MIRFATFTAPRVDREHLQQFVGKAVQIIGHKPVLQNASIGVLYGDVDTPVEETGMEVVGQSMKQVISLNTHLTASCNLQNAHSDQAKIYCKNRGMVPLTVLFYCSPLPTPALTLTSSQPRYCIVWPKYK